MTKQDDKFKNQDEQPDDQQKSKDETKQEIEKLKEQVTEYENSYKRALADYQNLQKRVAEERSDWLKIANREMLLRLLPILDTLFLAQQHNETKELKVIISMFLDTLKAEGVTKIETKDKSFDPQFMEVIDTVEGEDGKVISEMRSGFMIHDKLLRPAQVRVGKGK